MNNKFTREDYFKLGVILRARMFELENMLDTYYDMTPEARKSLTRAHDDVKRLYRKCKHAEAYCNLPDGETCSVLPTDE